VEKLFEEKAATLMAETAGLREGLVATQHVLKKLADRFCAEHCHQHPDGKTHHKPLCEEAGYLVSDPDGD
jgi:hypothetical protein